MNFSTPLWTSDKYGEFSYDGLYLFVDRKKGSICFFSVNAASCSSSSHCRPLCACLTLNTPCSNSWDRKKWRSSLRRGIVNNGKWTHSVGLLSHLEWARIIFFAPHMSHIRGCRCRIGNPRCDKLFYMETFKNLWMLMSLALVSLKDHGSNSSGNIGPKKYMTMISIFIPYTKGKGFF